MIPPDAFKHYIRDLAYLLREQGSLAGRECAESQSSFHEGREAAYREVLAWMQHQADAFGLDPEELCLAGFDALTGKLDPPPPKPVKGRPS